MNNKRHLRVNLKALKEITYPYTCKNRKSFWKSCVTMLYFDIICVYSPKTVDSWLVYTCKIFTSIRDTIRIITSIVHSVNCSVATIQFLRYYGFTFTLVEPCLHKKLNHTTIFLVWFLYVVNWTIIE